MSRSNRDSSGGIRESVKLLQTNFIRVNQYRYNYFDKSKVIAGGYYQSNGAWLIATTVSETDYIPVNVGDVLKWKAYATKTYQWVFWDANKTYVSGGTLNASAGVVNTVGVPDGATYFTISVYNEEIDTFMVAKNSEYPSTYYTYNVINDSITRVNDLSGSYEGKYLSILGDSISTFIDYVPDGNVVLYDGTNYGVSSVEDTWWKKIINTFRMHLCINNAWSGSHVTVYGGDEVSAGCMTRSQSLHNGTQNPDVIIVFMGINDFIHQVAIGAYDGSGTFPTDTTTFKEAYSIMLNKILTAYPRAEVFVCTLPYCEKRGAVGFPEANLNNVLLSTWNKAIRDLADLFGVKVLEHAKCGITYQNMSIYLGDWDAGTSTGLHPNAAGHSLIANNDIRQMDNTVRQRY